MALKILVLLFSLFLFAGCESEPAAVSSSSQQGADQPAPVFDTPPVAFDIFPTNILEDSQSGWIFLPYSDNENHAATSCSISNRSYVNVTSPCTCSAGSCWLKVSGFADYSGAASFKFSVTANGLTSEPATASFFVVGVDEAPVAYDYSASIFENTTLTTNGTLSKPNLRGIDPDGDPVHCIKVTDPSNGALTVNANCTFTYTPVANYEGNDSFTFKVSDGFTDSNIVTATITMLRVNAAPVGVDSAATTYQNTAVSIPLNVSDADGDSLTYHILTNPVKGTLSGTGGTRTYTPNLDYIGTDSFTFRVDDGQLISSTVTVSITVLPPVAFVSATGNDSIAVINSPTKPFATVQAAVNAVIAYGPSAARQVTIEVGPGTFGNVVLTQNFGDYVTWKGDGPATTIIGNISADGTDGAAGVASGDPAAGDYNGQPGTNGKNLTIVSDFTLTFGNISANGGNGGVHAPDVATHKAVPGAGGAGGTLTLTGYFGNISARGGSGNGGAQGGNITLKALSTSTTVDASAGLDLCTIALSCATSADSGNGGSILVESGAVVTGNVIAKGGENYGDSTYFIKSAGNGGSITIKGRVNGDVLARGGDSFDSKTGAGGTILGDSGSIITGNMDVLNGANTGSADPANTGGEVTVKGSVNHIYGYADFLLSAGRAATISLYGAANSIYVHTASVACDSYAGDVYVYGSGSAVNIYAYGGNSACTPTATDGYIDIAGRVTGTASVNGGDSNIAGVLAGAGGTIDIRATADVNIISTRGGNASAPSCVNGGNGGRINVYTGATYNPALFYISGGTGDGGCGKSNGFAGTVFYN